MMPKTKADLVKFTTGAVRGSEVDDEPYHMLSPIALKRYANAMYEGLKYSKYNYKRGIPATNLIDHALKHLMKLLLGDNSEDHLGHAIWNLCTLAEFSETRPDLFEGLPPGCREALLNFKKYVAPEKGQKHHGRNQVSKRNSRTNRSAVRRRSLSHIRRESKHIRNRITQLQRSIKK